MKVEWKYVVETFDKSFSSQKNKRIVLYGIGKHTKAILDEVGTQYHIVGLMDAERAGENLWGYPIFHTDELIENAVDFIVVIARPSVNQIIYRRIADFVEKNNIPVYTIKGEKLVSTAVQDNYDTPYYKYSEQDLLKMITCYDVISFDIFDTLLMRKVLYPKDVFMLLDEEYRKENRDFCFSDVRLAAEQDLKKGEYPTLDKIYCQMASQYGILPETCEKLKKRELEKEKELIVPRQNIVKAFHYALEQGKKVYIISDMYISSAELGKILAENGIAGYEKIIVSCEYGKCKKEGLFKELLEFEEAQHILHIGDHDEADIEAAARAGIHTFKVMSAKDLLSHSVYACLMDNTDKLYYRCLIGLIASRIFNNPFALYGTKGQVKINTVEELGVLVTPIILNYMLWMVEKARKSLVTDILFVARDGYFPIRLYRMLCSRLCVGNLPLGKYIYTSGRFASIAAIMDKEDVLPMVEEFKGDVKELIENIFLCNIQEMEVKDTITQTVWANIDKIMEQAQSEKEHFEEYLKEQKIDFSGEVLYFDLFSKGTGQDNIERIMGRKLKGIYLNKSISGIPRRNNLAYETLYAAPHHYEKDYNIFKFYSFLEYIFSSPEPCLKCIKNEEPVFYPEDRSNEGKEFMIHMQETIETVCKDFAKMYEYIFPNIEGGAELADKILGLIDKSKLDNKLVPPLSTYEWFRGAYKVVGV